MDDPMLSTPVAERTAACVLDRQVRDRPDKVALIDDTGTRVTYAELQTAAFRTSTYMQELGVARQEFVLVMLDNHVDSAVTWLGLAVAGMIEVPVNAAYKGEMLRYVAADCGARVAVIEASHCECFLDVVDELPGLTTIVVRGASDVQFPERITRLDFAAVQQSEAARPEPPDVSDVAVLLYTSGTEGASKGVLAPHGHAFQISASYTFDTLPDDVVLVALPLFHASGLLAGVYNGLRGGATTVILRGFSASTFWEVVDAHGVTQTLLMGAMADFLWRRPPAPDDATHTVKNLTVVPAMPYISEFAERFGVNITSSYGQAETGTATLTDHGAARPFLCGRPRSFMHMRVVGDDDAPVPVGTVGELVVRSDEPWSLMLGYLGKPEATIKAFRNLWLHTGDAAYQQEDGQFVFVDRKKDSLRRRGENVSSAEVEKHLLARDEIEQAAIVAVPSEFTEDDIKAVLVLVEGAEFDPESILREMVDRLPYFMVPRYYEVIDAMPATPTHKIKKNELRASGTTGAWDSHAAGWRVGRDGLSRSGAAAVNAP